MTAPVITDLSVSLSSATGRNNAGMLTVASIGSAPTVGQGGTQWFLTGLDGWWGSLSPRSSPLDREDADGSYDAPPLFTGRQVTVEGRVVATTRAAQLLVMDQLSSLLAGRVRTAALIVAEPDLSRQATVRLDGPTMIKTDSPDNPLDTLFSLVLYAADPLRYGTVLNSVTATVGGGSVPIPRAGNATVNPVITLTGPLAAGMTVRVASDYNTETIAFNAPPHAAGDVTVIDCAARTIRRNGVDYRATLTSASQFPTVDPRLIGSPSITLTSPGVSGGTAVLQWRDAWL